MIVEKTILISLTTGELQTLMIDSLNAWSKHSPENRPGVQQKLSQTILDTDELMAKLGVTRPTLSKWRKEGRIPFIQVGAVVRYDLDKVLEALESKKRRSR